MYRPAALLKRDSNKGLLKILQKQCYFYRIHPVAASARNFINKRLRRNAEQL